MDWISVARDWWWLIAILGALLGTIWRLAIKTNKLLEQVRSVTSHEEQLDQMHKDTDEFKEQLGAIKRDLNDHIDDQKKDTAAMMDAILSLLDAVKKITHNDADLVAAHKQLRKRTLDR